MYDVCFGYLDPTDQIESPLVADKVKQLTRLSVARLFQATQSREGKTVHELLRWFRYMYSARFMIVIKYGVILEDRRVINEGIKELLEHKAVVKGELYQIDEGWYIKDDFVIIDREAYERLLEPSWGEPGYAVSIVIPEVTSDYGFTSRLECGGLQARMQEMKGGGWGFIEHSMRWGIPVLNMSHFDQACLTSLEPTVGTAALAQGFTRFSLGTCLQTYSQHHFLSRHSLGTTRLGRSVELFDTEEQRPVRQGDLAPNTELMNLYSVASGFRAFKVLMHHGFNSNTNITYFDISDQALAFRRLMVERWDGTCFPRFIAQMESNFGFSFYPRYRDANQSWEDVLKTFGGPRVFKQFWDRYKDLNHSYRNINLLNHDNDGLSVSNDPRSYIWWSDAFCTNEAYLMFEIDELADEFRVFMESLRLQNRRILMDGRDYHGRWV